MTYLAHSADSERGIPAQGYCDHVSGAVQLARSFCDELKIPVPEVYHEFLKIILLAAEYHDLGKLAPDNQAVLNGIVKARHLPIDHTDAGALLFRERTDLIPILIYCHHIGLPNLADELIREELQLRSQEECSREDSDKNINSYKSTHDKILGNKIENAICMPSIKDYDKGVLLRQLLSLLVDADHSDTARNYGGYEIELNPPKLRAKERLAALDSFVADLAEKSVPSDRNRKRKKMYELSRKVKVDGNIFWCDSPVGTGKTTAVMASLLKMADEKNLRRIFVVLPFTNIINQSVDVYRKALVLDGEDPERVVAAVHHRAEYDNVKTRQMSTLWNAPVVVTTAVQFFETMAAARTSGLRKLHNLPGSAVFIDESHAALPIKLWPLAWRWIKEYAEHWSCSFVLASGSLTKFWELKEIDESKPDIPSLLPQNLREELETSEKIRVPYRIKEAKMNEDELTKWIATLPGPRLVILNTVQSAAAVAQEISEGYGRDYVEHISTALSPLDREKTVKRIKERLTNKEDSDWTLVGTSCVEAGVDFSFRTGVREAASLVSLLQTAGRVRRNNEPEYSDSAVWTIFLNFDGLLKKHPAFGDSSAILLTLFQNNEEIGPQICTKTLKKELLKQAGFKDDLLAKEKRLQFKSVEEKFKVIDSDSVTVIITDALRSAIESGEDINWRTMQDNSVQIWSEKAAKLHLCTIKTRPDLYYWPYKYDNFIGYMAGVIDNDKALSEGWSMI